MSTSTRASARKGAKTIHRRRHRQPRAVTKTTGVTPRTSKPRPEEVSVQAYTVEQVAEILQIGRDKVYHLLRTGQLRSIKIGKLRRITDRHLADFIASLELDQAI